MDRLLRALGIGTADSSSASEGGVLVAGDVSLEAWNRLAQLDALPRGLELRQLLWNDGNVWIVEPAIEDPHEVAESYCRRVLDRALGRYFVDTGHKKLTGCRSDGTRVTYSPDDSGRPKRGVPGIQVPQGISYSSWVTVIIEVLHRQSWSQVYPKVEMYRRLPGVQYVFCVKMSEQLNCWSYELYDVGGGVPPLLDQAARHSFDIRTTQAEDLNVAELESRRVLGLAHGDPLPQDVPETVRIDVLQLAMDVFNSV